MANFPFPNKISQASVASYDQKFLVANYGDGFEQRVGVGINNKQQSWSIQLNNLDAADRQTFMLFWANHGRVQSFDWTPPNQTAGKFIFNSAVSESNRANRYSFSFELRQVYE